MLKGAPSEGVSGPGTTVGVNVALTGTLKDQNDIAIYGMVDGEVISELSVTIGQSAQVKGPVKGQLVTVAGIVRGSVEATEKLEVLETGKVFGSINARDLVVHSGAILIGDIKMASEETSVEIPEPPQVSEDDKEEVAVPIDEKKESKFDLKPDDE